MQGSQESVTAPLLGGEQSAFYTARSHEPLQPQTQTQPPPPRHTFQPQLRINTTLRSTPRSKPGGPAGAAPDPSADGTSCAQEHSLEAFGSRALEPLLQPEESPEASLAQPSSTGENAGENANAAGQQQQQQQQQRRGEGAAAAVAVAKTFSLSPGAFSAIDAPKVLEEEDNDNDDDNQSTNTRDTSMLEDVSVVMSADQYPATPRTPGSPRGGGEQEQEQGLDDDRSIMNSQPTDTQSMKSYYRVFGNRCGPCFPQSLVFL